jgi:hypothetical protein
MVRRDKSDEREFGDTVIFDRADTKAGGYVKGALNRAAKYRPVKPDTLAAAAAGGLTAGGLTAGGLTAAGVAAAASAPFTGGAVVAGAGLAAMYANGQKDANGDPIDVFGDSMDELGAFYGMLQLKLRSHAPLRAAYSAIMVWVTLLVAELLSQIYVASRTAIGGDEKDNTISKPLTVIEHMYRRAGLSNSLRNIADRSTSRYAAELNECSDEAAGGQPKPPCEQRVITRGMTNLGIRGFFNENDDKEWTMRKWRCRTKVATLTDANGVNTLSSVCSPPTLWWESMQQDLGVQIGRVTSVGTDFRELLTKLKDGDITAKNTALSVYGTMVKLFGGSLQAIVFVSVISVLYGLMSYYTVVWNMSKIRGRCDGDGPECEKDLLTLQMAVNDTSSANTGGIQSVWDPVAQGTMGWIVADVLLSSVFL